VKNLGELLGEITDASDVHKEILSHPEIKNLLVQHESDLNIELLPSFMGDLDEFLKNKNNCEGCAGLKNCCQPVRGHYPILESKLGRLKVTYTPCNFEKSSAYLKNIQSFYMPSAVKKAKFEDAFEDKSREMPMLGVMSFMNEYLSKKTGKGIYFHGSHGTGKTYMMAAVANELAKSGVTSALVYFPELIAQIKSSFGSEGVNSNQIIEDLKNVPVLMLDDIGAESVTSWMRDEILGRILNYRMQQELPTFFTSNFDYKELEEHYKQTQKGEYEPLKAARIMERIKALSTPISMIGKNYRY